MFKITTISVSIQWASLFELIWIIVFLVEVSEFSEAVHFPQVSEIAFYIQPLYTPYVTTKLKIDNRIDVAHRQFKAYSLLYVQSSWNLTAHGEAREVKWRGNWWMESVASTLHTTSEHGVSSITTAYAHTIIYIFKIVMNFHLIFTMQKYLVTGNPLSICPICPRQLHILLMSDPHIKRQ